MFLQTELDIIKSFTDWKEKQKTVIRGNILMYDVKHYKYLEEHELFNYYEKNLKK